MYQMEKGNQWLLGMNGHIGVDVHSGLVLPWWELQLNKVLGKNTAQLKTMFALANLWIARGDSCR